MQLVDGDLIVRPPTASDAAEIVAAVRFSIDELLPWMVWASADYDVADAEIWATKKLDPYPFVMTTEVGEIIGTTGLNGQGRRTRASLGIACATTTSRMTRTCIASSNQSLLGSPEDWDREGELNVRGQPVRRSA